MVTVRVARPDDEERLHAIDLAAWSAQVSPGERPADDSPFFRPRLLPDDVLVAERDGVPVGFVAVMPASGMPSHQHVLVVNGLGVAPEAQGAGVGRRLMTAAVDRARARGARKLTLRVLSTNATALRLYESLGFVVEGRLVAEYRLQDQDVDDLLMALPLDGDAGTGG